MTGQPPEPNRVLGFPVGRDAFARRPRREQPGDDQPTGPGRQPPAEGEEPQRVLGFPVDWFRHVSLGPLRSLARAVAGRKH